MRETSFLKFGAISAIVGAVVLQVSGVLHPESERIFDPAKHMSDIALDGGWVPDHFGFIVAFVFLVAGMLAICRSMQADPAADWARLAFCFGLIAAAFATVFFTLDGFAFKYFANAYMSAPPAQQPMLLEVGRLVGITENMFFGMWTFLAFGILPFFFGIALLKGVTYRNIAGWFPVLSGLAGMAVGCLTIFNGFSMSYLPPFYISILMFNLWMIAMGVFMWKKANARA
jgi:hypothetical protein